MQGIRVFHLWVFEPLSYMPIRCLAVHWPYPLCPLKLSLDYLEQKSVCNLNLSIGLWVGGSRVVVFDPQLLVEVFKCDVVKLLSIVRDKNPRDLKVANHAFPNKVLDILLGDGSQGFYLYPFCEVIDSYDEELELLYRHREMSHDVESSLSDGPQSVHRSELFQ